jgi:hypothetical protein
MSDATDSNLQDANVPENSSAALAAEIERGLAEGSSAAAKN